jgi:isoquinoline 1-oxidoreductase alpha subunit
LINLLINGLSQEFDVTPQVPLLWVLRDEAQLTGTKFGCGMALCGACTVQVDGVVVRACVLPVGTLAGKAITTIEGIAASAVGRAVQAAWLAAEVVQCGYCQSGQIVAATALLANTPQPTDADIDTAMSGNICRCGTYPRIRQAIHAAARLNAADAAAS